jgi:hypothetical protein
MRAMAFYASLACACFGQTSVAPPFIGIVRDCAGQGHRVFGVGGAFRLGPAEKTELPTEPADAKIEGGAVILRRADGSEKRLPLPDAAAELRHMGPGWLAAVPFAIKLTADGAMIYRLPMKACVSKGAEAPR